MNKEKKYIGANYSTSWKKSLLVLNGFIRQNIHMPSGKVDRFKVRLVIEAYFLSKC